ncbi:hypothetical protein [Bradyrhizobium sp. JR3.5]
MTWKKDYIENVIATPAQMGRFGINENFDALRNDRNARYLIPLSNPTDEEMAAVLRTRSMAHCP